jgi:flagellar export protein FliJ
MAFHFSLAAVLRFRESIEQREYLALERIQQEIGRVELRINQIERDFSVAAQGRAKELAEGTRAAVMQSAYEYEKALEQEIERLRKEWQELKIRWKQQLAYYELARRNRETLDKLREKQLSAYTQELAKREQAVVDDLFLSRRRRGN